jgi:nitroimidazol reductase NimA-like FMN-containing flavoprotein (pyridoxamine 5'-phosphate oxidase superfamily)
MRLKRPIAKLVARERVCRIATAGRSREPHVVPVCHVLADGKIYFGSGGDARKVKHLRANPQAAVTVDVYTEDWSSLRGVTIQGSVSVIEKGRRFQKIRRMLFEKYPQYPDETGLGRGDVIVEITPKHVFSWGID